MKLVSYDSYPLDQNLLQYLTNTVIEVKGINSIVKRNFDFTGCRVIVFKYVSELGPEYVHLILCPDRTYGVHVRTEWFGDLRYSPDLPPTSDQWVRHPDCLPLWFDDDCFSLMLGYLNNHDASLVRLVGSQVEISEWALPSFATISK